jgi:hypothetical protein
MLQRDPNGSECNSSFSTHDITNQSELPWLNHFHKTTYRKEEGGYHDIIFSNLYKLILLRSKYSPQYLWCSNTIIIHTVQSVHKWYGPNTWCLSRSLCWWHPYICDRPQRGLRSQKAAARFQCYWDVLSTGTKKLMKIRLRLPTFLVDSGPLRLILHWMDGISPLSLSIMYICYLESKFRWAVEKKKQEFISKSFGFFDLTVIVELPATKKSFQMLEHIRTTWH